MFGFAHEVDGEHYFTTISIGTLGSYHNTFKETILSIHQDFLRTNSSHFPSTHKNMASCYPPIPKTGTTGPDVTTPVTNSLATVQTPKQVDRRGGYHKKTLDHDCQVFSTFLNQNVTKSQLLIMSTSINAICDKTETVGEIKSKIYNNLINQEEQGGTKAKKILKYLSEKNPLKLNELNSISGHRSKEN